MEELLNIRQPYKIEINKMGVCKTCDIELVNNMEGMTCPKCGTFYRTFQEEIMANASSAQMRVKGKDAAYYQKSIDAHGIIQNDSKFRAFNKELANYNEQYKHNERKMFPEYILDTVGKYFQYTQKIRFIAAILAVE